MTPHPDIATGAGVAGQPKRVARRTTKSKSMSGSQNFALIHRYALSLLKREPTKMSVAMKRRKATWSDNYFLDVLSTGFSEI